MRQKWQKIDGRRRFMIILAALLGLAVLVQYADISIDELPTSETIARQEKKLRELKLRENELKEQEARRQEAMMELQREAQGFWDTGNRAPAVEVQKEFDRLARRAHVVIQTIGSPRTNKISDNVMSIEINVRTTASMADIARLLAEMEKAEKPLYWRNCTLRPDNNRTPQKVVLSGVIQALVISQEVRRLSGQQTEAGGPT